MLTYKAGGTHGYLQGLLALVGPLWRSAGAKLPWILNIPPINDWSPFLSALSGESAGTSQPACAVTGGDRAAFWGMRRRRPALPAGIIPPKLAYEKVEGTL